MKIDQYAQNVLQALGKASGQVSLLPAMDQVQTLFYAGLMTLTLPRAEADWCGKHPHTFTPYPGYTVDFCRGELKHLAELGALDEVEPFLAEVQQRLAADAYMTLYRAVYAFMPPWTCNAFVGNDKLPVYSVTPADGREVFLVNEALLVPFEDLSFTNYPIPLRQLKHGTWRRFDKFPYPYDRSRGIVEGRLLQ